MMARSQLRRRPAFQFGAPSQFPIRYPRPPAGQPARDSGTPWASRSDASGWCPRNPEGGGCTTRNPSTLSRRPPAATCPREFAVIGLGWQCTMQTAEATPRLAGWNRRVQFRQHYHSLATLLSCSSAWTAPRSLIRRRICRELLTRTIIGVQRHHQSQQAHLPAVRHVLFLYGGV